MSTELNKNSLPEQDLARMMREVKRQLKMESKNNLITMIQQLLFEKHYLIEENKKLKSGEKNA